LLAAPALIVAVSNQLFAEAVRRLFGDSGDWQFGKSNHVSEVKLRFHLRPTPTWSTKMLTLVA
jgi:hypothetical protein